MIRAGGPFELERQRTRLWNLADKQMEICARQMRYYCKEKTWARADSLRADFNGGRYMWLPLPITKPNTGSTMILSFCM